MKLVSLDRVGSLGALIAAIAAPCCFPLFAAVGTAAGFSALGPYEGVILYIFQGFALLTLAGLALSKCGHRVEETMPTNACVFFYDCPACPRASSPWREIVACFAVMVPSHVRRFKRASHAAPKMRLTHYPVVARRYVHYYFCRIHQTLCVTPAMEAKVSDHAGNLDEAIALLD